MSRIEDNDDQKEPRENQQRQPIDRTPGKAEGDENTIDEALRNDENAGRDRR